MRQIQAAVVRDIGGPFAIETLQLDDPRDDEVIVRIVATGMCHSDIVVVKQEFPLPLPWVLGHEGAGIVEQVGAGVTHVVPGDPVVLSFDSCGHCPTCTDAHSAYCGDFMRLNFAGVRSDGTPIFGGETDVKGGFFYQSSFATFALAHARNVVKVRADAPLDLLGPLGCGVQTGAGAVLNVLRPKPGSSFCLFGAGAVGLSGLMAAKLLGCDPIIAVDKVASRLELARTLGATITIDAGSEDVAARLAELGGVDLAFEASGVPAVAHLAIQSLRTLGTCALVGVYPAARPIAFDLSGLAPGATIRQIVEGDADPQIFIPELVDHFMAGNLPFDRMARFYPLDAINDAMADSSSGATVKPIIRISE